MVQGLILTCVVLLLLTLDVVRRGHWNLLSPIAYFLGANIFLFVLKPLWMIAADEFTTLRRLVDDPSPEFVFMVFLAINLSLLGFYLGYMMPWGQRITHQLRFAPLPARPSIVLSVGALFVFLGLRSFILYRPTPLAESYTQANIHGYFTVATAYLAFFCFHIWGVAALWWTSLGRQGQLLGGALAALFVFLITYGGWHRNVAVSLILALLITYRMTRRIRTTTLALLILVAFLSLRPFFMLGRNRSIIRHIWTGEVSLAEAHQEAPRMDWQYFEALEGMAFALYTIPRYEPYRWGATYADVFLSAIPRRVWKSKRNIFTEMVLGDAQLPAEIEDRWTRGQAYPMVAELYQQAGWLGILLGMGVAGIIWRAAYEIALRHAQSPYVRVIYAAPLSLWPQCIHGGHFGLPGDLYLLLLPVVICILWEFALRRPSVAAHAALKAA
ncbi:MAG: hypothetical protein ACUVX8_02635 [Candidatus Zipacnadales bacterium]